MKDLVLTRFDQMDLTGSILSTLRQLEFTTPTPIQAQAIPVLLEGRDVMGLAQTGTGKTGAFGLPLIQHLLREPLLAGPKEVRALILAPTRELASQIATSLRAFAKKSPLKIGLIVGGQSARTQADKLAKGTDILVATPGRLLDHAKQKTLRLDAVTHLVLDEADQMLDLGFIRDLRRIAKMVPSERQTAMFSATMPKDIASLARDFLSDPVRLEVTPPGKAADKIEQAVAMVERADKPKRLRAILSTLKTPHAIIFTRTKHGADRLSRELTKFGYGNAAIHGNKSQGQRTRALEAFKSGQIHLLVATDVAARGIDIPGITHVFNYDLPEVADVYVHRIGRTARAGADGQAIAFCSKEEQKLLREIEKLMKMKIERIIEHRGDGMAKAADWFADQRPADAAAPANASGKPGRRARPNRAKPAGSRAKAGRPQDPAKTSAVSEGAPSGKNRNRSRSKPRKALRNRNGNRKPRGARAAA